MSRLHELTSEDHELVERAKTLIRHRKNPKSDVAAVLRTKSGKIFEGINIELEHIPPCSICAEYAAIGTMHTSGEEEIEAIVAVNYKNSKYTIYPPCGKCRQFISNFGDPFVILPVAEGGKKACLSEIELFEYK